MQIKRQKPLERGAGVLLPISSLPSPYGIGTFGQTAMLFSDFLYESGLKYWQVLPLGPTSYGDSPYQSFSAFAGNPYFIDLDTLIAEGLLTRGAVESVKWLNSPRRVDYGTMYENRFNILKQAFSRSSHQYDRSYKQFLTNNRDWLDDYALFMALKDRYGGASWTDWPDPLRFRDEGALEQAKKELETEREFWRFCQYHFHIQWSSVRTYAAHRGVKIIGDMPIYVALDSADVWANPELFDLDENKLPNRVAGVPPDMFSQTGQLWGNPIYNWRIMEKDNFAWWCRRMEIAARLYDVVRIDHFVGIAHYYSVPADYTSAVGGLWQEGPGDKLISAISNQPETPLIIAEDLGEVTPQVIRLRQRAGYPGMRLYQMAFNSDGFNGNLPAFYGDRTVVYGGTHDNETLVGYFKNAPRKTLRYALEYFGITDKRQIPVTMVRTAYASAAAVAVFQMQDYMGLDNHARMNTPSTATGNWTWRLEYIPVHLAPKLRRYTQLYGR